MKVVRLVVLGQLAEHGAMHGHEIRRRAERTDVAEWGGVPIGSLYRELRLMAEEGLVVAVRSEQVGRRPERTIYEITDDGWGELAVLRERAVREFSHPADPVGVALLFAGGLTAAEWAELLAPRRRHISAVLQALAEERQRHTAHGHLGPLAIAAFRRGELHLQAELAWYTECDQLLDRLEETAPTSPAGAPTTPTSTIRGQHTVLDPAPRTDELPAAADRPAPDAPTPGASASG